MRPMSISIGFGLFALCLVGLPGCSKPRPTRTASRCAAPSFSRDFTRPTWRIYHWPRIENYHTELTNDEKTKQVGVYVLGEDAATAARLTPNLSR